jgi:predicted peptidase
MYQSPDGERIPYRLLSPAVVEKGRKYPLILFLHGAGERGSRNERQLIHGSKGILQYAKTYGRNFFFLAPQCPEKQRWVEVDWKLSSHRMPEKPSKPMKHVMELMNQIMREHPVDRARIYVCGLSMGGFGTWDLLMRQPELFAAAMPICGGGDVNGVSLIRHIPIWAFHGALDQTVSPERTRKMVRALQAVGGLITYTEYPEAHHNSWTRTFQNPDVWDWLFAHRKPK